jgi:TonB family protein
MQNLILECAVRASLIAIGTGAVLHILRVKAARARHVIWASVVILMLALPAWTAWGPRAAIRVLNGAPNPTSPINTGFRASTAALSGQALPEAFPLEMPKPPIRSSFRNTFSSRPTWRSFLTAVYLLGLCALLGRLAIGTVRAHLLVRRASDCEGRLASDSCAAPITIGWLNPTVVLPECWRRWPHAQLHAVLMHEDEHARRRDPLVQWLALLNRAVFWFHPLAWWLERRLSTLAEEACDAAVLARGHDPLEYSEYLLEFARAVQQTGGRVNVVGMAMPGTSLPRRIRRILDGGPVQRISRLRMTCVAVACAVVSTPFMVGAVGYAQARTDGQAITSSLSQDVPAPAGTLRAIEPVSSHPSQQRPKVLLAQAQTSPAKPNPSPAQSTPSDGGSLSGTVEDPGGARVPGSVITVIDQAGASIASTIADAAGFYRLASIPPGHYRVEYSARGFATLTRGADIEAAKAVRIDAWLQIGQMIENVIITAPKPASSAPPPTSEPGRIRVGGNVQIANLIKKVNPIYPLELKQQGVEGTVVIRAVISKDGVPLDAQVINADEVDPRLAQVALDSLQQWRYRPAMLNAEPVEVLATITLEFRLAK